MTSVLLSSASKLTLTTLIRILDYHNISSNDIAYITPTRDSANIVELGFTSSDACARFVSEFKNIVAGKDLPFLFRLHERPSSAPTPLNRTQFTISSHDPLLTKESVLQQITSIDLSPFLHQGRNDPTAEVRDSTHAFTLDKVATNNGVTTYILTAPTIPAASAVNFIFYLASRKNVHAERSFTISQTFTDTHTLTPTPPPPPPHQHNPPLSNNQ